MRARPVHPLLQTRRRPRRRDRRGAESPAPGVPSAPLVRDARACEDPAVQRVREAGGPIDHAAYTCECGYRFVAPVSTTVHCPHCHVGQAW